MIPRASSNHERQAPGTTHHSHPEPRDRGLRQSRSVDIIDQDDSEDDPAVGERDPEEDADEEATLTIECNLQSLHITSNSVTAGTSMDKTSNRK